MARTLVNTIDDSKFSKVGEVKYSMLDEATFQSIHGTGWVLMAGQDLSITNPGSDYETLTGQSTLPDARGRFLRGLDTTEGTDPDFTTRTLGSTQDQATKANGLAFSQAAHNHVDGVAHLNMSNNSSFRYGYLTDNGWTTGGDQRSTSISKEFPYTSSETPAISVSTEDDETRPKNLAVNVFIKINEI